MIEAVKDKGYLKSLEKFGQKLDLYLEQNPNKDEVQEAPTKDEEGVAESEVPQDNSNNATKMFRKRALFSQTCNTMYVFITCFHEFYGSTIFFHDF